MTNLTQQPTMALDLNQLLIRNPASSYLFTIAGHQWAPEGIFDGDIALIDRRPASEPQSLVVSRESSGFRICRSASLDDQSHVWGVITAIIHRY